MKKQIRYQLELESQEPGVDRAWTVEGEVIRRDGSTVWTETTMKILKSAEGLPESILGVTRDITERRKTEENLRLNTAALESAANSVTIADAEGTVLWVNPAFTALTGYTSDEIVGQGIRVLNSDLHGNQFYEQLRASISLGNVWRGELNNKHKNGTDYQVELTITPVRSIDGTITHYVGIEQDITQRKEAEDAVREAEKKYRTLVENADDAIAVTVNGEVVYRNEAYNTLLGYKPGETGRHSFLDNIAPEQRDMVIGHYQSSVQGDASPKRYEVELVTRSQARVSAEIRPRMIEFGGVEAIMVVMRDTTERKQLEQQLFQAQKMESIGQLASGVAHDFNNLLSAVTGFAQLASMQLASTGRVDAGYLDEIQGAASRGADLTRQLLTFSRTHVAELKIVGMKIGRAHV
jgi:PAS domain S-box-containing protein